MALAHRTRQSGNAAMWWPITVNGSGTIKKQDSDWPPRYRFATSCVPEPIVVTRNIQ